MNCPNCGKGVSDKSEKCWYCGNPIKELAKPSAGMNKTLSWLIFAVVICVVVFFNQRRRFSSDESDSTNAITPAKESPTRGSSYCISQQSVGAYSEKNYELLTKYSVRKEAKLFGEMIMDGRAVILEQGTKVFIEDAGIIKTVIRLPNEADQIWIASEFVKRCN